MIFDNWEGKIEIDGVEYENKSKIRSDLNFNNLTYILLKSEKECSAGQIIDQADTNEVRIQVKQYMTKPSTPDFDFMSKWNNDVPMPLQIMVGTIEKETRGMVYMKLHADTSFDQQQFCMKCGKPIDNPISQYFGMGPICGCHNYVNPFNSEDELHEAVSNYKKTVLSKIEWEGWIIRSAIIRQEEV
jgi:hypothetical protein